jgi:hypothetical protein
MSIEKEIDEVIVVDESIEKGYFYLENRHFHGPYETQELASQAAIENCLLSVPGECRAIYHGSTKRDQETNLNEPLADMRQTGSVESPATAE